MSLYSWIRSFSQLMSLGKESCAGAAEVASRGRSRRIPRKNQQLGQGKKANSSNKCQHQHQILLPTKPQVQTKIQNIHLKVTFHMFSPIALQLARQDQGTAAPCVGSAVFTIGSWGLQLSQALSLCLFCWLILWPKGLLACQPVVFILHSNVAQNLCTFTETKCKTKQQDLEGLPGVPFPCVPATSPLVRGSTSQVTSHTPWGWWWHQCPGAAPGHQGRSFPADMSLCWNPASNYRKCSVTLIVTLSYKSH